MAAPSTDRVRAHCGHHRGGKARPSSKPTSVRWNDGERVRLLRACGGGPEAPAAGEAYVTPPTTEDIGMLC